MNFKHCFGINGPVRDNVLKFKAGQQSDELLIFPVGRSVAAYDANKKTMDFFKESRRESQEVTSLALSHNEKFLAICDRDEKMPETQVAIFSTISRKQLRKMTGTSKEGSILSACFSRDSKLLVTSSKEMITVWLWEKEKINLSMQISDTITRVRCPMMPFINNPISDHVFSASGLRHLKLWTLADNKLSSCMVMPSLFKEKQHNFTDHIWLKDEKHQFAAVADNIIGNSMENINNPMQNRKVCIMIFQVSEKSNRGSFQIEPIHTIDVSCKMSTSVETICGYKNGFILAGNCGFLSFYQKNLMKGQEKSNFCHISSFACGEKDNFTSLCVKEDEDQVIIFNNRKRLLSIPVEELKVADDSEIIEKFEECLPVHIGVILDMDVSLQNSILATCAQDRSIRIWNYNTFQCELVHQFFSDEPTTISINPNGYQILVGLKNRFIGYHLLLNEILPYMEVVCIDCQKVRFSTGGHIFAVSAGSNILVFSTYNDKSLPIKPKIIFHGHTAPLNTLIWNFNDTMLYSTGKDGKIYGWDLITKSRFDDLNTILQPTNYISIVKSETCPDNINRVAVCNADGFLFELSWLEGEKDFECSQISLPSSPYDRVTALCLSTDEKYLYAGTAGGFIRHYEWPLHSKKPVFKEYPAHNCGFSKIKGNPYGLRGVTKLINIRNLLISVGVDGSIFVFNDGNVDSKGEIMKTEVVFIRAVEYYDAKEEIVDVKRQLDEIKKEHEFVVESKDMSWQSKLDELSDKSSELISNERLRFENLRKTHHDATQNHAKTLENVLSKHDLEFEKLKSEHEDVLNLHKESLDGIRNEMEDQKETYESKFKNQKDNHDKQFQVLELKKDQVEGSLTATINRLRGESKQTEKIFKEVLNQQEEEYEMELVQLNMARDMDINQEEDKTKKLQGFVRNINTKRNEQDKRYQELKVKLETQEILLAEERKIKKELQLEIEKMGVVMKKKEDELKDKVNVIKDLKLESSKLETHKFVLTDQLQEVKDERAPLKKQIEDYERHISSLKEKVAEICIIIKKNSNEIEEKQVKINIHKKENITNQKRVREQERELSSIKREITYLMEIINKKELAVACKKLYQKAVKNDPN